MQLASLTTTIRFDQLNQHPELCAQVQQILIAEGLLSGPANGLYGPKTENALVNFKRREGLTGGNNLGPTTAKALLRRNGVLTKVQADTIYGRQLSESQFNDLITCLKQFNISSKPQVGLFLAQTAHETGGLRWFEELASGDKYEFRVDLGNTNPGDGPRFKGGGALHITGRFWYQKLADFTKDPRVMEGSRYVAERYPFTSAGLWWQENDMNSRIDAGDGALLTTRAINGGENGLEDRIRYCQRAADVLGYTYDEL